MKFNILYSFLILCNYLLLKAYTKNKEITSLENVNEIQKFSKHIFINNTADAAIMGQISFKFCSEILYYVKAGTTYTSHEKSVFCLISRIDGVKQGNLIFWKPKFPSTQTNFTIKDIQNTTVIVPDSLILKND